MSPLPPCRLSLAALLHAFLGTASISSLFLLNSPADLLRSFGNDSFIDHYDLTLTQERWRWLWSSITIAPFLGALFGSVLVGVLAEKSGRRTTCMFWSNLTLLLAASLQLLCKSVRSVELLLIGRLISGIPLGFLFLLPVFIAECSPDFCRGFVASLPLLGMALWPFLSSFASLPELLGSDDGWPYIFLFPAAAALLHLVFMPFLQKSPKHLYLTVKNDASAEKSLQFYHGIDREIVSTMADFEGEAVICSHVKPGRVLWGIFRSRPLRMSFFVSTVAILVPNLSGQWLLCFYLDRFSMDAESEGLWRILAPLPLFFFAVLLLILVEKVGRRKLLLFGNLSAILGLGFLFGSYFLSDSLTRVSFFFCFVILASSATGFGFLAVFLCGEICPQGIRFVSLTVVSVLSWVSGILSVFTFSFAEKTLGAYSLLPFLIGEVMAFIILWFLLPETKDLAVYEVVGGKWGQEVTKHRDDGISEMPEIKPLLKNRARTLAVFYPETSTA